MVNDNTTVSLPIDEMPLLIQFVPLTRPFLVSEKNVPLLRDVLEFCPQEWSMGKKYSQLQIFAVK